MGAWMDLDQMKHDFDGAMKGLRTELAAGLNASGEKLATGLSAIEQRMARLERKDEEETKAQIAKAYEEGLTTGRLDAMEKRLDKVERWIIGMAFLVFGGLVTWVFNALGKIPFLSGGGK